MNQEGLELFFKRFDEATHRNHTKPDDMWEFGEKGFMMGRGGEKNELVISNIRVKPLRRAQDGNREWVTLIECVSDTGKRLPAFYTYAGAAHHVGWHRGQHRASKNGGGWYLFL